MTRLLFSVLILVLSFNAFAQSGSYKVGMEVEILWSQRWYKGSIIKVEGDQYRIHYDGYGDHYDEWVKADRLRSLKSNTTPAAQTAGKSANSAGKKRVEVKINGFWYKATVLQQDGDRYFVHYDGYGSADDRWVLRSYTRDLNEKEEPVTVTCSFQAPQGTFSDASPASAELFKKEVYDYYNRTVTGGITSPLQIGVVFSTFKMGTPYKNTVTNVPGTGATRKHEGAPVNTLVYPVTTTFFVCKKYNDGVTQDQVNSSFSFFKNKEGEWTCSKDN